MNRKAIAALAALLFISPLALAQTIPPYITAQGRLSDQSGNPLTGPVDLTFSIYAAPDGGSALWTETEPSVPVQSGYFQVEIGSNTDGGIGIAFSSGDGLWLGTTAGSDPEMTPRMAISTMPYAFTSQNAVGNITPTSVTINGQPIAPPGYQLFTLAPDGGNSFTFTAPPGVTMVHVSMVGGGGGGGLFNEQQAGEQTLSGGGGASIYRAPAAVQAGQSYNVVVGTGGAGAATAGSGANGGSSSFPGLSAPGGAGGENFNNSGQSGQSPGGAVGTPPVPCLSFAGGAGASGVPGSTAFGGWGAGGLGAGYSGTVGPPAGSGGPGFVLVEW